MTSHLRTESNAFPSRAIKHAPTGLLQRKCACGNQTLAGSECEACGTKRMNLQRRAVDNQSEPSEVPPIIHEVLRSSGRPLDAEARSFMEPRFGHDFSEVRVHTDAKAAESAQAVNALAYTVGRDVVFGAGQYAPRTSAGRRLMAHELTHVVQQGGLVRAPQTKLTGSKPGDASEREADRVADAVSQEVFSGMGQHQTELESDQNSQAQTQPHAWQQTKGETRVRHHVGPALQRQPALPAGPQSWASCAADRIGQLNSELAEAVAWVTQAISDLQAAERPARTNGALVRYLSTDPAHIRSTIIPNLQAISADLNRGGLEFSLPNRAAMSCRIPGRRKCIFRKSHYSLSGLF